MTPILQMIALALGMLLVIYLPSLLILRALNVRGSMLLGLAPVWTAGVLTAASLLFDKAGIAWTLAHYTLLNVVLVVLFTLLGIMVYGHRALTTARTDDVLVANSKPLWVVSVTLIVTGALLYWLPTMLNIPVEYPAQQNDSTFHLSALMTIVQTGKASPLTAFSSLYGLEGVSVTYPAVWHQLAALFATETTVVMTSKATQLVIATLWLINIHILARVALPRTYGAGLFAVAIAQIIPIFPVYYHVELPLWPNAIGIALLPGLLAALLTFFRAIRYRTPQSTRAELITHSIVIILGAFGITAAYPPAAFSLLALLSGGAIVALARVLRSSWGIKTKVGVASASLAAAGVVGIVVSQTEAINWLFARPIDIGWNKLVFKTWVLLVLSPAGGESIAHKALLALFALVVLIGVLTVWRQRATQWITLSWIVVALLVLATLVPLPLLTNLTALWYYGSYRLMPVLAIMNILTATSALSTLWDWALARRRSPQQEGTCQRHTTWVVCATLAVMILNGATSWSYRSANAHQLYEPPFGHIVFMADEDELSMIFRAKDKLTDDKLILGEGSTGATLIYIVSGHPVVYKQVTFGAVQGAGKDSAYLADHFRHYQSDPKVCDIINRYNIGYFYADQPQSFNLKRQDIRASGLFRVPVDSPDFTEIDRGGLATLYRFTGCESKQP